MKRSLNSVADIINISDDEMLDDQVIEEEEEEEACEVLAAIAMDAPPPRLAAERPSPQHGFHLAGPRPWAAHLGGRTGLGMGSAPGTKRRFMAMEPGEEPTVAGLPFGLHAPQSAAADPAAAAHTTHPA